MVPFYKSDVIDLHQKSKKRPGGRQFPFRRTGSFLNLDSGTTAAKMRLSRRWHASGRACNSVAGHWSKYQIQPVCHALRNQTV